MIDGINSGVVEDSFHKYPPTSSTVGWLTRRTDDLRIDQIDHLYILSCRNETLCRICTSTGPS